MVKRVVAMGALAAAVVLAGCGETEGAQAQGSGSEGAAVRRVNVEVTRVEPQPFAHFIRVVGTVEAQRDVMVSAEEGGVVEEVLARKGSSVRPGQPLVRLDAGVLEAQLEQAASQAALAEETWERQRRLWEQDSVGTEMAYLQARYNAQSARAQARVLAERMERTVVRAPVAGVLDDRRVEVGTMVSPGAPIARVLDLDTVEVVGGVAERFASDIEEGSQVSVTVDALGGREYTGAIGFVNTAVDAGSRTFVVEVEVPNPGLGIKPGMVADVRIARRTLQEALAVPRHAVLRQEDGYVAFVAVEEAGEWRARARRVVPGVSRGELVVIQQGLEPGDRVVTVGQQRLVDGDVLTLVNEERPDASAGPADEVEERGQE